MPRSPRAIFPGQPLHLVQRGNDRMPCFVDDQDFLCYLDILLDASTRSRCAVHAYVLMTNHVHLLATPEEVHGPARMMQALGRRYVRYFNERHGRTGTLWEGRYRSTLVDSSRYFLACSRYIERNPVRAGLVARPREYKWSSYRCNALGLPDLLVTPHATYRALGISPRASRAAYRALFPRADERIEIAAIRRATATGTVLGGTRFREWAEHELGRPLMPGPNGGDRRSEQFRAR